MARRLYAMDEAAEAWFDVHVAPRLRSVGRYWLYPVVGGILLLFVIGPRSVSPRMVKLASNLGLLLVHSGIFLKLAVVLQRNAPDPARKEERAGQRGDEFTRYS